MTILAGIAARRSNLTVPDEWVEALHRNLSRHPGDAVVELRGKGWVLAKIDIGAYGVPAVCEDAVGASMLVGDPLILPSTGDDGARRVGNRATDLMQLQTALSEGSHAVLRRATGTYCGAQVDKRTGALRLFTDRLGVRTLYYSIGPDYVTWATALRILEALPFVAKSLDIRGVSELACFGFPLAHRTPYQQIAALRAGEILSTENGRIERFEYWRWDQTPVQAADEPLERKIGRAFAAAVRRRLGDDSETVAFLSGGLDSRSIVATLRQCGATVHTINFSPLRTQDEVFGKEAASALQTIHYHLTKDAAAVTRRDQVYNQSAVNRWFDTLLSAGKLNGCRRIVWSGDGGSVGMGHVYLTEGIVELAQQGRTQDAIDAFLVHNRIHAVRRLFRKGIREEIAAYPADGLREELAKVEKAETGRAFHLFLMLNDQRRHLVPLYEHIDLGRLEFHLPFFDADLLALVIGSPIKPFLLHRFYLSWLQKELPQAVTVPWQSYPGHAPCPLPQPEGLGYQWSSYYSDPTRSSMRGDILDKAHRLLASKDFPTQLLNPWVLRAAVWLMRLGIRDSSHVINAAEPYVEYWGRCQRGRASTDSRPQ